MATAEDDGGSVAGRANGDRNAAFVPPGGRKPPPAPGGLNGFLAATGAARGGAFVDVDDGEGAVLGAVAHGHAAGEPPRAAPAAASLERRASCGHPAEQLCLNGGSNRAAMSLMRAPGRDGTPDPLPWSKPDDSSLLPRVVENLRSSARAPAPR